jgi:hypothetical protein
MTVTVEMPMNKPSRLSPAFAAWSPGKTFRHPLQGLRLQIHGIASQYPRDWSFSNAHLQLKEKPVKE